MIICDICGNKIEEKYYAHKTEVANFLKSGLKNEDITFNVSFAFENQNVCEKCVNGIVEKTKIVVEDFYYTRDKNKP